jgi:hypothetical protein
VDQARAARQQYFGFLMLTTLVALVCAIFWYVLPIGLGFQEGPANPATRRIAATIFAVLYFVGLPALLLGQIISAILWFCRLGRGAYIVPVLSIGSFLLCAATFWVIFFHF